MKGTAKLSKRDMRKLITNYLKENGGQMDSRYERLVLTDLEYHLKELGVNDTCPKCGSKIIVHNGKRSNGIQRLRCSECGKSFTYFTGTILEKTKFHWDLWIEVIYQMLHNSSIKTIKKILVEDRHIDSITNATIEKWRYKIFDACEKVEQPKLHGVIEVDETHYHESQKGTKECNMIQVFPGLERKARRSYRPAQYGVMGSEFATIITAVDKTNHAVLKVSGLGKFDTKTFKELFREHIKECNWLCSDDNKVYSKYCDEYNINHYVRPSDYLDVLKTITSKEQAERMYNNRELDYVEHQYRTYKQIETLKKKYGLNLGKVNGLHERIREKLNYAHRGVSSKHLKEWVAWISVCENFKADHGELPVTKKDAEEILKLIIKTKANLPVSKMFNNKLDLPKPADRELKRLKANTDKSRLLSGRHRFVFTETDLYEDGKIRDILYKMPLYLFKEVCKVYATKQRSKYKGYTTYLNSGKRLKYIQFLEKEENIKDTILEITAKTGKEIYSAEEDSKHRIPPEERPKY